MTPWIQSVLSTKPELYGALKYLHKKDDLPPGVIIDKDPTMRDRVWNAILPSIPMKDTKWINVSTPARTPWEMIAAIKAQSKNT